MKEYIKPILEFYQYKVEQGYASSTGIFDDTDYDTDDSDGKGCSCGAYNCNCNSRSECRGNGIGGCNSKSKLY